MSDDKRQEWIILVAQTILNKSKFPKSLNFKRYKPWKDLDANRQQRVLYAKYFIGTAEEAEAITKFADDKIFSLYVTTLNEKCVINYTMLLHNITKNESKRICSTINGKDTENSRYLYENVKCSNKKLAQLGIMVTVTKGL